MAKSAVADNRDRRPVGVSKSAGDRQRQAGRHADQRAGARPFLIFADLNEARREMRVGAAIHAEQRIGRRKIA
jgi:hypothetical protein